MRVAYQQPDQRPYAMMPMSSGRRRYVSFGWEQTMDEIYGGDQSNMLFLMPFYSYGMTISKIGLQSAGTATAGTVFRIAVYVPDPVAQIPKTLLLDAGTVAATSTGDREITLGSNLVLPNGLCYAGAAAQSCGADMPGWRSIMRSVSPLCARGANQSAAAYDNVNSFSYAGVSGAAPSTLTAADLGAKEHGPIMWVVEA